MTARAFLIRGLVAGLLAGLATFFVAHLVGEPHVEAAIAQEESGSGEEGRPGHSHEGEAGHSHGEEGAVVSRDDQRTWGLLTGTLTVSLALGGVVGLVAAGVAGRLGSLTVRQSTAVVTLIGFASFALVPFLKYPSTPPAVGAAETIGSRTGAYFGFLLASLVAAVGVTMLAARLRPRVGTYTAVVGGVLGYVGIVVLAGRLFPAVNEIGEFPGDTLWSFRLASLVTLTTMWGVIGVVLTGLLGRLHDRATARKVRDQVVAAL